MLGLVLGLVCQSAISFLVVLSGYFGAATPAGGKPIGEASTSINSEHIRSGREKLASALRTNSSSIIEVIEQRYGIDGNEVSSEVSQT